MSFPIVFASDENYIIPTYVAISSLLHNIDPNTDIEVFILCSGIKEEKKRHFYNLSNKIHFLNVEISDIALNEDLSYISIATYYRFLIPKLLSEYDKCLYLDSDIIVNRDISPLLASPIEDYLLMGVRNYFPQEGNEDFYRKRCSECGIEDLGHYVNAGVLLMNLQELRKDDLWQRMLDDAHVNQYTYNDQDILNKYCYGRIGLLSFQNNFMVHYLKNGYATCKVLGENIYKLSSNPVIVHYATKHKPWKYKSHLMANFWQKGIQESISDDVFKTLVKPYIKKHRADLTFTEKVYDQLKYIYRKYIVKNFICTTQRSFKFKLNRRKRKEVVACIPVSKESLTLRQHHWASSSFLQ